MSLMEVLEQLNRDCHELTSCERPAKAYAKVQLGLLSLRDQDSVSLVIQILRAVTEFSNKNPKISKPIEQAFSKATSLEELELVYDAICSEDELDAEIEREKARIREETKVAASEMTRRIKEEERRMALIRHADPQDHINRVRPQPYNTGQRDCEQQHQNIRNANSELRAKREKMQIKVRELLDLDEAARAEVLASEPIEVVEYWNEFLDRREAFRARPMLGTGAEADWGCPACGPFGCRCWR